MNAPWATNNYYALQAIYERRFTKGLGFNANYTWAHGLGDAVAGSGAGTAIGLIPSDVRADYGNSGVDVRNRFAANLSYQLPFGENTTGAKALLVKGWQSNFLIFWQSGQPFGVTDGWTNANGSAQINLPNITADRPDLIPPGKYKTKPSPSLSNWLNPAAFTPQPAGTLGDEGNNPFHGPHTRRADLSLLKDFNINEKLTAQFRAECFNISNTPNFLNPELDYHELANSCWGTYFERQQARLVAGRHRDELGAVLVRSHQPIPTLIHDNSSSRSRSCSKKVVTRESKEKV